MEYGRVADGKRDTSEFFCSSTDRNFKTLDRPDSQGRRTTWHFELYQRRRMQLVCISNRINCLSNNTVV